MSLRQTIIPPSGPGVGFPAIPGLGTTTNFTFGEAGRYRVTWLPQDSNVDNKQPAAGPLQLNKVVAGVATALITMTAPGHYDVVLPTGGYTMNFQNLGAMVIKAAYLNQVVS